MNDNLKSNGKDQLEEAAKARVKEFIDSNNIDNVIGVGLVRLAGGGPVFVKVYLSDLCDHNECPTEIDGVKVFKLLKDIPEKIDTITFYVAQNTSSMMLDDVIDVFPRRIIFNPGAENPDLFRKAQEKGIDVIDACTLVLLSTQQF